MTKLDEFNLSELGIFIGVCSSAMAALLLASQKSKCESICWGMCKRNVSAVIEEERLEMTGHTGSTPRLNLESKELAEPQTENP
tara:strand:- start:738 stop:989 length:252 start_codon:yes stop_codon:yes gene_type:complete